MKCLVQHAVLLLSELVEEITKWHFANVTSYKMLQVYPNVSAADAMLLALWKFFHCQPLATNFVKNTGEMYNKKQVTLICQSVTRSLAHDQACKNLWDGFNCVSSCNMCQQKEGTRCSWHFVEITFPKFLATFLTLCDIFAGVQSLKVVSATFLLVCFACLKEKTCETRKNIFYFTSKALFVLEIIKF